MTDTVKLTKINEVYMGILAPEYIYQELSDYFTFSVPGAWFQPSYRNKNWDGKIRLFNRRNNTLYLGLLPYIELLCHKSGYKLAHDGSFEAPEQYSGKEAIDFVKSLELPEKIVPREYQLQAFVRSIRDRRNLLLSPTASGKSLIIYFLIRYYRRKTLILVPTINLTSQMYTDFQDYGFDSERYCHVITAGADKISDKPIVISTWQSLYDMKPHIFKDYRVVIGDEAHLFKAKSLKKIMGMLPNAKYRHALTGTLDNLETNRLTIEGLFGSVRKITTTKELIDKGHLSPFRIKALILDHPEDVSREHKKDTYQEEVDFLVSNESRSKFIKNLALSLKGNTLLLFQLVDKHGRLLYNGIQQDAEKGRKVFFVCGETEKDDREAIRKILETERNAIIVASYGTFSTGVNIPSIEHLIFASPSRSRIRVLQSIGRALRQNPGKKEAILYDIADDMSYADHRNYTLNHFAERMKIYNSEEFDYKIYKVKIDGKRNLYEG
tara:strand:+ start:9231 stop:10715 length:1485 start_codon:yes stop_codon:yes gene_type:complete